MWKAVMFAVLLLAACGEERKSDVELQAAVATYLGQDIGAVAGDAKLGADADVGDAAGLSDGEVGADGGTNAGSDVDGEVEADMATDDGDGNESDAAEVLDADPCLTAQCDDSIPCTIDGCVPGGGCTHTSDASVCDDGNPCTSFVCNVSTGCIGTNVAGACNDGNACTSGDACGSGACGGAAITCDDGKPCTVDTCVPASGCLSKADSSKCDDSNPCTADTCDAAKGCVTTAVGGACSDGSACTSGDVCVGGVCKGALNCDDGNDCTDDSCASLACQHVNSSAGCDDGNACTSGDKCGAGACKGVGTVCGNGACDCGETKSTCSQDCGVAGAVCGDGKCENAAENCQSCPVDCGTCPGQCSPLTSSGCPAGQQCYPLGNANPVCSKPGSAALGQPCIGLADCALGMLCSGGVCGKVCDTSGTTPAYLCKAPAECAGISVGGKTLPYNVGLCIGDDTCNLVTNVGCASTLACTPVNDGKACVKAGTGGNGAACTSDEDCLATHLCVAQTQGGPTKCFKKCVYPSGSPSCPSPTSCIAITTGSPPQSAPDSLGACTK